MTRGCYEAKSKGEFKKQSIGFKLSRNQSESLFQVEFKILILLW
jgi:hypothetical protein